MRKCRKNKGFSLVELIIVIAIMAILVGVMAPQLLRYLEKAKVTSDLELISTLSAVITYASVDPDILDDPASQAIVDEMGELGESGQAKPLSWLFSETNAGSKLTQDVLSSMGWSDEDASHYMDLVRSKHSGSSQIYMQRVGGFYNPIKMWISYTDATGHGDFEGNGATNYDAVTNEIAVK